MQERVLSRKEIAPLQEEQFPKHLSPRRRKRDPVLYVPGFFRFYVLSAGLRRRLKNLDFEVYYVRIPNFTAGDIRKAARVLLEKTEMMRVLLGVRRLSVIGQGLGGLIARCMVEQLGGKDYLGRLIMLGTPNHGSYIMYAFFPFKAARQMFPASSFLSNLNFSYRGLLEKGEDLHYVSVCTPYELVVVPRSNCYLEGAENLRTGWFCTHMGLVRSRAVSRVVAELLEEEGGEESEILDEEDALLRELTATLQENPQDEGALYRRADLLLQWGYYGRAIDDLNRLIKIRPNLAEAYLLRGKAHRGKMSYDENPIYNQAIRDFNQVIRLKPGLAEAYYHRGVCYALLNSWSDALDNWDRALILNRDLYPAYLARGLVRRNRGDIARAVEDFREVLRIQPDEPEALRFLSEIGGE